MIYVGIDPGLDGAIGVVGEDGRFISVEDSPTESVDKAPSARAKAAAAAKGGKAKKGERRLYLPNDMSALLSRWVSPAVTIENVHAMPTFAVRGRRGGQGVTSAFSMGYGMGIWIGVVAGLRLVVERVEPSKWKRDLGIPKADEYDKEPSLDLARRLWPSASLARKRDDGRAEALLIAEWRRRRDLGLF